MKLPILSKVFHKNQNFQVSSKCKTLIQTQRSIHFFIKPSLYSHRSSCASLFSHTANPLHWYYSSSDTGSNSGIMHTFGNGHQYDRGPLMMMANKATSFRFYHSNMILFKAPPKNNQIKHKRFRFINDKGENLGIMSMEDAMKSLNTDIHDLVLVKDDPKSPVCKALLKIHVSKRMNKTNPSSSNNSSTPQSQDPSKKELEEKEDNEQRQKKIREEEMMKRHRSQTKEIEISSLISDHDLAVKFKKIQDFLDKQYQVQITCFKSKKSSIHDLKDLVRGVEERIEKTMGLTIKSRSKVFGKEILLISSPKKSNKK